MIKYDQISKEFHRLFKSSKPKSFHLPGSNVISPPQRLLVATKEKVGNTLMNGRWLGFSQILY